MTVFVSVANSPSVIKIHKRAFGSSQVGRFFGEVDGSVMASLIKMGMYKKYDELRRKSANFPPFSCIFFLLYVAHLLYRVHVTHRVSLFDYQAMCKNSHHHASSAHPLLNVSAAVIATHVTLRLSPAGVAV